MMRRSEEFCGPRIYVGVDTAPINKRLCLVSDQDLPRLVLFSILISINTVMTISKLEECVGSFLNANIRPGLQALLNRRRAPANSKKRA